MAEHNWGETQDGLVVPKPAERGVIPEHPEWPRVGVVGVPGRMFEVAHDKSFTNVVLSVLGRDRYAGAGCSPHEARELAALLVGACIEIDRRRGRAE